MANSSYIVIDSNTGQEKNIRLIDNGDGTFSIATAENGQLAATLDSVTAKQSTDALMSQGAEVTPKFLPFSASSVGNNTILAAVSGKKIRILAGHLSFSGTTNVKFQSGTSKDITKLFYGVANTQTPLPYCPVGLFETDASSLLNLNLSAAVAVDGFIVYVEI